MEDCEDDSSETSNIEHEVEDQPEIKRKKLVTRTEGPSSVALSFKDLETRIADFQRCKFPKLRMPGKRRKKKGPKSLNRSPDFTPNKNVRIPTSLRPSPIPEFKLPKINSPVPGPGFYPIHIHNHLPGIFFSNQARFVTNADDKFSFILNKPKIHPSSQSFQYINKRNKDLEKFTPVHKEELDKKKSKERDLEAKIHKKAKFILEEHERKNKEEKYLERVEKFEWRSNIMKMSGLAEFMFEVLGVLEFASLCRLRISDKKVRSMQALRKKSLKSLGFLCVVGKFVGRIKRMAFKRRLLHLLKLTHRMLPNIQRWLTSIRKRYREAVDNCIEKPMLVNHFFELMADFLRKIRLVQRSLRQYLIVRNARTVALVKKIEKLRSGLLKRSFTISQKAKKAESIPQAVLQEHIYKYCKSQIQRFLEKMSRYKEDVKQSEIEYDEYLKENFIEIILHGKVPESGPKPMKRPTLTLFSDNEGLQSAYKAASTHLKNLSGLGTRFKRNAFRSRTVVADRSTNSFKS